jgi:hypothetical protein
LIKIGVMDSSPGNGHMFSFSAIINGLNDAEKHQCEFQTIQSYISNYVTPVNDIAEISKVSGIYMNNLDLAERVAKFANINTIYDSEIDLVKNVDVLIITNDDPINRNPKIPALLKFGKPVFLDKIISYDLNEYNVLKASETFKGQIFSSSAMQHAPAFKNVNLTEDLISLEISVPKSWPLYSVHAIELFLSILRRSEDGFDFVSHKIVTGADVTELRTRNHQTKITIIATNISGTPFQVIEKFRNGSQNILNMADPFEAFSIMIREFLLSVMTNTYADKREWDLSIMEIISKGLN